MNCPECGGECERDEVDVGVGTVYGPWGCFACRWCEDEQFDLRKGDKFTENGGKIDQWGGVTPKKG